MIRHLVVRCQAAAVLAGFLGIPVAWAQDVVPSSKPTAQAFALTERPEIDGNVLGDPAWTAVTPARGFTQIRPDEGKPASQQTEVYIGYTEYGLYIGVVAYDDNPEGIIIADSRRDSSLDETDSFRMIIDGFRDGQNGLIFGTNPVGIQYDAQVVRGSASGGNANNLNVDWDTSWEVRAQITDIGWSAEFEIPFRSLRYGAGDVQSWGINFQRNIRRNNEVAFWAPLARQFNIGRVFDAGTLSGLEPPPLRNFKVIPYGLASVARGDGIDGQDTNREIGVDVKYSITPSLTLDATLNTDFAQVEVDDVQVNLDRFSLFFPEKRFFFLENAAQFNVGTPREVEMFFSRRIGIGANGLPLPIDGGLRVSGKVGPTTNVGLLHMRSAAVEGNTPQNDFSVARVSQEFANRSSFGGILVSRDGDGSITGGPDYNRTYGIDGSLGIGAYGAISGWAGLTDTPGLEGREHAFSLRGNYDSPYWSNSIGYTEVGENFNPEVGFLTRSNYRRFDISTLRRHRPENGSQLLELRPHVSYRGFWDFDGFHETGFLHIDNHFQWRSGSEIHTGVNFTREGVKEPFEIAPGVIVQPDTYDHEELQLVFMSNAGAALSGELRSFTGGFFGGERISLRPTVRYRLGETLTSELTWNYNDLDLPGGRARVNVGQLRLSYSFTPKVLLQALLQYDDRTDRFGANVRFSVLESANAGLFVVFNQVDEEGLRKPRREVVIKYSKIFDIL